jgi:hypothetical protein
MSTATLALAGYSKLDALSVVACHVHFPGLRGLIGLRGIRGLISFVLPRSAGVKGSAAVTFKVPALAKAVCVTLVWRYKGGWLRHGRCRFTANADGWNLEETKRLLYESTLKRNGTAKLSFEDAPGDGFRGPTTEGPALAREWFFVPEHSRVALKDFGSQSLWYSGMTPLVEAIRTVHMPFWNSKPDSIPGWFFAFERSEKARYGHVDFIDVFAAAKTGILGFSGAIDRPEQRLVLAWGLCLFGLSIQYQSDKHFGMMNEPVERFSSNARFDGIGDCEDIAKEICLAHGDLCKLTENTANLDLIEVKARARQYKCVIMLGTVAKFGAPEKKLAHAFAMLVPNWFFGGTRGENDPDGPLLCDGTYPAYPTTHGEWKRPWEHHHIVSAMILGEGEIYFADAREPHTYGIDFDDFFPAINENVHFAMTHRPLTAADQEHVQGILASNLPVQKHTFGFEHQSIVNRFVSQWSNKAGDFARLNRYCANGLANPAYFDKIDRCLDEGGFSETIAKTLVYQEMAFTMEQGGHVAHSHDGQYGSVSRDHPELGAGGHTHHREKGKDFRRFNVPTPEDVMTFVTHRTFGMVNGHDHPRDAELVVTHNNVYELADTNDADGLVAELVAQFSAWDAAKTTPSVALMKVWAAVVEAFVARGVYDFKKGLDWPCLVTEHFTPGVFEDQTTQDAYINLFEPSVGVSIRQIPVDEYTAKCGIQSKSD